MPRPGLTPLPFKLPEDFLAEVDRARGHKTRSHFVREALAEKLAGMGVVITDEMIFPPDRTGVGGRPRADEPSLRAADDGQSKMPDSPPRKVNYREALAEDRKRVRKAG